MFLIHIKQQVQIHFYVLNIRRLACIGYGCGRGAGKLLSCASHLLYKTFLAASYPTAQI
jgi:hypothetical protein